jgi:hypothetical protein
MPDPSTLLRDAEVLRKFLTECLRRVDRLERHLRTEAARDVAEPTAPPLTDPFEQALPEPVERPASEHSEATPPARRRPSAAVPEPSPTVRTLPLSPSRPDTPRGYSSPDPGPTSARGPELQRAPEPPAPAASPSASPSGDGALDPFALIDVSVPRPRPDEAETYRGMEALLGGLDVSPSRGA